MPTANEKTSSKEKAVARRVLRARSQLVCKPMTCKITDPWCGKLTKCVITCKIK